MNEDILKIVRGYRPIDDDFMKLIFAQNNALVQYVLRIILEKDDLVVEDSDIQKPQKIWGSRSLIYDVLAKDTSGKIYNIEFQKADSGASPKRARYHAGALDVRFLEPGDRFDDLPDTYVIFITENDVLKKNQPTYTIERTLVGFNEQFNDGSHIVYVNCSYVDRNTEIGKLIHDLVSSNADEMLCQPLADVTRKYKETPEGVKHMCKAVENYGIKKHAEGRAEGRAEIIERFIRKGDPLSEIADLLGVSIDEVTKVAESMV